MGRMGEYTEEFCPRCGRPVADGGHADCVEALQLEPPRYCAACRRRMVVQVFPGGWQARCSVHGESSSVGRS